jgi:hypothetical protein
MSDYMLKYSKRDWAEGADGGVMPDKGQETTDQGRMGTDARSRERQKGKISSG